MIITCGERKITTRCKGCLCHEFEVTFGETAGKCDECGCPKTPEAFDKMYEKAAEDGQLT